MSLMAFCLAIFAPMARAYEYPLQFTPNAGYRGLVVAGYEFTTDRLGNVNVVGNCSYYTVSTTSGGGKGSGRHTNTTKNYYQSCTWDQFGGLLSVTPLPQPLDPPPAASAKGNLVIYATNTNGDTTGTDSKRPERGFVNTPGAHYTWLTPNSNPVLRQTVYTHTITLKSDGDVPVDITDVAPSALHGIATLKSTTCIGETKVGKTCTITVTYDPRQITSTKELADDTIRIDLTSNAGEAHDFIQNYTIVLPQTDN